MIIIMVLFLKQKPDSYKYSLLLDNVLMQREQIFNLYNKRFINTNRISTYDRFHIFCIIFHLSFRVLK